MFFLPFHSVFVSKRSLGDGDFVGASWLLFLGTQRSWYGFGRLPGRVRFFLKFTYWLFMNYGKAPGSHRGTEGMAMAAPPCCPRPFALDREVKVDACHTSDVVSVCLVQSCIVEGAPGHNRWEWRRRHSLQSHKGGPETILFNVQGVF